MVHPKHKLGTEETGILVSNISTGNAQGGGGGADSRSKGQHEGSRSTSGEAGNRSEQSAIDPQAQKIHLQTGVNS